MALRGVHGHAALSTHMPLRLQNVWRRVQTRVRVVAAAVRCDCMRLAYRALACDAADQVYSDEAINGAGYLAALPSADAANVGRVSATAGVLQAGYHEAQVH